MTKNECNLTDGQMDFIGVNMSRRAREIANYARELKRRPVKDFCVWFNSLRDWVQLTLYELDVIEKAAAGKPIEFEKPSWASESCYPVEFVEESWQKAVPIAKEIQRDSTLPLFGANHGKQ